MRPVAQTKLTRRTVLGLLVVGGTATAVGLLWRDDDGFGELIDGIDVRPEEGRRFAAAILSSTYTTRMSPEFGRLYLEQRRGATADLDTLAAEVMARLEAERSWRAATPALAPEELDSRLGEAIAADFLQQAGLCEIDGWYLSATECRLAAMKYLSSS